MQDDDEGEIVEASVEDVELGRLESSGSSIEISSRPNSKPERLEP